MAASGYLHLFNPSSTTFVKHFIARFSSITNEVCKDTYIAGSNVRLYPKVINTNTVSGTSRVNYLSSGDLFDVMEIGTITSQFCPKK